MKDLRKIDRKKTKYSRAYLNKVASLNCLICNAQANVHHIRVQGIKSDYLTVPLCKEHHQGDFSIHNCQQQFEDLCGSELHLLSKTIELINKKEID